MCPMCMAAGGTIAAGIGSAGALTVLAATITGRFRNSRIFRSNTRSKENRDES